MNEEMKSKIELDGCSFRPNVGGGGGGGDKNGIRERESFFDKLSKPTKNKKIEDAERKK